MKKKRGRLIAGLMAFVVVFGSAVFNGLTLGASHSIEGNIFDLDETDLSAANPRDTLALIKSFYGGGSGSEGRELSSENQITYSASPTEAYSGEIIQFSVSAEVSSQTTGYFNNCVVLTLPRGIDISSISENGVSMSLDDYGDWDVYMIDGYSAGAGEPDYSQGYILVLKINDAMAVSELAEGGGEINFSFIARFPSETTPDKHTTDGLRAYFVTDERDNGTGDYITPPGYIVSAPFGLTVNARGGIRVEKTAAVYGDGKQYRRYVDTDGETYYEVTYSIGALRFEDDSPGASTLPVRAPGARLVKEYTLRDADFSIDDKQPVSVTTADADGDASGTSSVEWTLVTDDFTDITGISYGSGTQYQLKTPRTVSVVYRADDFETGGKLRNTVTGFGTFYDDEDIPESTDTIEINLPKPGGDDYGFSVRKETAPDTVGGQNVTWADPANESLDLSFDITLTNTGALPVEAQASDDSLFVYLGGTDDDIKGVLPDRWSGKGSTATWEAGAAGNTGNYTIKSVAGPPGLVTDPLTGGVSVTIPAHSSVTYRLTVTLPAQTVEQANVNELRDDQGNEWGDLTGLVGGVENTVYARFRPQGESDWTEMDDSAWFYVGYDPIFPADLTKTSGDGAVSAGSLRGGRDLTFTLTYENTTGCELDDVTITDDGIIFETDAAAGDAYEFVSVAADVDGQTGGGSFSKKDEDGFIWKWRDNYPGKVPKGQKITFDMTVNVTRGAGSTYARITNRAGAVSEYGGYKGEEDADADVVVNTDVNIEPTKTVDWVKIPLLTEEDPASAGAADSSKAGDWGVPPEGLSRNGLPDLYGVYADGWVLTYKFEIANASADKTINAFRVAERLTGEESNLRFSTDENGGSVSVDGFVDWDNVIMRLRSPDDDNWEPVRTVPPTADSTGARRIEYEFDAKTGYAGLLPGETVTVYMELPLLKLTLPAKAYKRIDNDARVTYTTTDADGWSGEVQTNIASTEVVDHTISSDPKKDGRSVGSGGWEFTVTPVVTSNVALETVVISDPGTLNSNGSVADAWISSITIPEFAVLKESGVTGTIKYKLNDSSPVLSPLTADVIGNGTTDKFTGIEITFSNFPATVPGDRTLEEITFGVGFNGAAPANSGSWNISNTATITATPSKTVGEDTSVSTAILPSKTDGPTTKLEKTANTSEIDFGNINNGASTGTDNTIEYTLSYANGQAAVNYGVINERFIRFYNGAGGLIDPSGLKYQIESIEVAAYNSWYIDSSVNKEYSLPIRLYLDDSPSALSHASVATLPSDSGKSTMDVYSYTLPNAKPEKFTVLISAASPEGGVSKEIPVPPGAMVSVKFTVRFLRDGDGLASDARSLVNYASAGYRSDDSDIGHRQGDNEASCSTDIQPRAEAGIDKTIRNPAGGYSDDGVTVSMTDMLKPEGASVAYRLVAENKSDVTGRMTITDSPSVAGSSRPVNGYMRIKSVTIEAKWAAGAEFRATANGRDVTASFTPSADRTAYTPQAGVFADSFSFVIPAVPKDGTVTVYAEYAARAEMPGGVPEGITAIRNKAVVTVTVSGADPAAGEDTVSSVITTEDIPAFDPKFSKNADPGRINLATLESAANVKFTIDKLGHGPKSGGEMTDYELIDEGITVYDAVNKRLYTASESAGYVTVNSIVFPAHGVTGLHLTLRYRYIDTAGAVLWDDWPETWDADDETVITLSGGLRLLGFSASASELPADFCDKYVEIYATIRPYTGFGWDVDWNDLPYSPNAVFTVDNHAEQSAKTPNSPQGVRQEADATIVVRKSNQPTSNLSKTADKATIDAMEWFSNASTPIKYTLTGVRNDTANEIEKIEVQDSNPAETAPGDQPDGVIFVKQDGTHLHLPYRITAVTVRNDDPSVSLGSLEIWVKPGDGGFTQMLWEGNAAVREWPALSKHRNFTLEFRNVPPGFRATIEYTVVLERPTDSALVKDLADVVGVSNHAEVRYYSNGRVIASGVADHEVPIVKPVYRWQLQKHVKAGAASSANANPWQTHAVVSRSDTEVTWRVILANNDPATDGKPGILLPLIEDYLPYMFESAGQVTPVSFRAGTYQTGAMGIITGITGESLDNCITLAPEEYTDALGRNRVKLSWQYGADDSSVALRYGEALEIVFTTSLALVGEGYVAWENWLAGGEPNIAYARSRVDAAVQLTASASVNVPDIGTTKLRQLVMGSLDGEYRTYHGENPADVGQTAPGGTSNIKVQFRNNTTEPVSRFVIGDLLTFKDATGQLVANGRVSNEWSATLKGIGAVTRYTSGISWTPTSTPQPVAAGYKVYVSEAKTGEQVKDFITAAQNAQTGVSVAGLTATGVDGTDNIVVTNGTTVTTWRPYDPAADNSSYHSYGIVFDLGAAPLGEGGTLEYTFQLLSPVASPEYNLVTWNRVAVMTDGGGSAYEPNKVGLTLRERADYSVGDYVWWDRNRDGIQNEGSGYGIDGVLVVLLKDGEYYASTTTSSGGYYIFEHLPAGRYEIGFRLHSAYIGWTTLRSGGDSGRDSDAGGARTVTVDGVNYTFAMTGQITLGPLNPRDLSWDAGMIRASDGGGGNNTTPPGGGDYPRVSPSSPPRPSASARPPSPPRSSQSSPPIVISPEPSPAGAPSPSPKYSVPPPPATPSPTPPYVALSPEPPPKDIPITSDSGSLSMVWVVSAALVTLVLVKVEMDDSLARSRKRRKTK
ncbi:MAG: hypothetical protein LBK41_01015 [Clostridiales bacterium]|jgi:hypothetical protein|nr:hypothetical protein [Clostridiales bacterium]